MLLSCHRVKWHPFAHNNVNEMHSVLGWRLTPSVERTLVQVFVCCTHLIGNFHKLSDISKFNRIPTKHNNIEMHQTNNCTLLHHIRCSLARSLSLSDAWDEARWLTAIESGEKRKIGNVMERERMINTMEGQRWTRDWDSAWPFRMYNYFDYIPYSVLASAIEILSHFLSSYHFVWCSFERRAGICSCQT